MQKIAIFPGSFDPITLGHFDIARRAIPLFDKIIVAVGENSNKNYMFSLEQRKKWIAEAFSAFPCIEVDSYKGLTVDYCRDKKAHYILRGLRNPADFEFEKAIAHTNRTIADFDLETIFLLTSSGKSFISSSIVRDVIRNGGDYTSLVPKEIRVENIES